MEGRTPGLRAYLGVPLLVENDLVGTLELGSRTPEAFHEEDLALVRLLSGQAGIALHNALIYRQEQKRSAELNGLSQMAQAFGAVRDPKTLFARLVAAIAPMINVQILGFLTYNDVQRTLEAQIPYHGLPDQIVELYRTTVPLNSMVKQTLLDQDVLISKMLPATRSGRSRSVLRGAGGQPAGDRAGTPQFRRAHAGLSAGVQPP